MKKISVLSLILALAIGLTGCFGGESKLYNAFNKMQDITSLESDMEIQFTFNTEGFKEEEQLMLQQVAAMVNTSKLKMHTKQIQNKDKTVAKSEINTNINLAGMGMDMGVWVDVDMSTDKMQMIEIIKMPPMMMSAIFPGDPAKEYIVYNIGEMINTEENIDYTELMKFSKEWQPKLTEFIKQVQKDFKPEFDIVKEKSDRVIDGKKLNIYELQLNDATLKELVKYSVNYSLDEKVVIDFIKEYMNEVMKMVNDPEEKEIKEELANLEDQIPEFKSKFNEFMEEYKDIKILGEKGILIEYGINKEGYIVHEVGTIDLSLNLEEITKKIDENMPVQKGKINLTINYNSKNYNINSKDIKVEMPVVNENNSIDLMKMMEEQMKNIQQVQ